MKTSHLLVGRLLVGTAALALPRFIAAPVEAAPVAPPIADNSAPNFVVIVGEAQGWTSGSFAMDDRMANSRSDFYQTPNLAKLAQRGMRFSNAYAASPRCTPSRAALFTGINPAQLGMTFVGMGPNNAPNNPKISPAPYLMELPESEVTLPELLKPAGYASAHFGKWHLGKVSPARHGFEENDGPNNNSGPDGGNPNPTQCFALTNHGIDFMARQVAAKKPFYLHLSHYPGGSAQDALPTTMARWQARFPNANRRTLAQAACNEDMDTAIGQVLDKITALGIEKNTYVIYTSDHGAQGRNANEPLRGGKGTIWEGGTRVPFIVSGPDIAANTFSALRASGEDLLPTVADLAGIKSWPARVEGGSLAPILRATPDAQIKRPRASFVVHFPHYDLDETGPASSIYTANYKLVRAYENDGLQLFDLAKDSGETRDLSREQPEKTASLARELADYLREVGAKMPSVGANQNATATQPAERGGAGFGNFGGNRRPRRN